MAHARDPKTGRMLPGPREDRSAITRRSYHKRKAEGYELPESTKRDKVKRAKAWNNAHPERADRAKLKSYLKRYYGLSIETYDTLIQVQDGRCRICRKVEEHRNLSVDHDHVSGSVRGLLCNSCNTGLGMFRDNPELLEEAAKYLRSK